MNTYRTFIDRLMVEARGENRRVVQYLRENTLFMFAMLQLLMVNVMHISYFYAIFMSIKIACEYKITGVQFMQFLGIYVGVIIVAVIMVCVCVSDMLIIRQPKTEEHEEHEDGIITEMDNNNVAEEPEEYMDFQTIKDKFEALKLRTLNLEKEFGDEDNESEDESEDESEEVEVDVVYPPRKSDYLNITRTNDDETRD